VAVSGPTPVARSSRPAALPAWLRGYQRPWLTRDLIAGLTLWALVVPEAMAYASIAGVPPQFGLYSVPLAVLAYAWLGSSQRLFVGPSSTIAALTATVVAPLAAAATDQYVALTAVLSLLVGAVFVGLAALPWLVELAGIEPASFGAVPGLLRVQSAVSFSQPRCSYRHVTDGLSRIEVPRHPSGGGDAASLLDEART
jgi:sulfate permease, SulP family